MLKALLVDDEEVILRMLSKVLEMEGFTVVTAGSAATGIAMLAREEVDLVITDLRMESPLAGFEVVRVANESVPRPVIVILTAFPLPASDWKDAGADALCVKGMNTLAFPKQLKALVQQHRKARSPASSEP